MKPGHIQFYTNDMTEVLRISKDGITANPDIPADDAAKLVLDTIHNNIKVLVKRAVEDERESCAKLCNDLANDMTLYAQWGAKTCANAIFARGKP